MNLYEINEQIIEAFDEAIDPETGELIDEEAYDRINALQEEFLYKCEGLALYFKNLNAEALALKAEKEAFAKRQKAAEQRAKSIAKYLETALKGRKLKFTQVEIGFRNSEAVQIVNEKEFIQFYKGTECVNEKIEHTINKNYIKRQIKKGEIFVGAWIEERQNIQIK